MNSTAHDYNDLYDPQEFSQSQFFVGDSSSYSFGNQSFHSSLYQPPPLHYTFSPNVPVSYDNIQWNINVRMLYKCNSCGKEHSEDTVLKKYRNKPEKFVCSGCHKWSKNLNEPLLTAFQDAIGNAHFKMNVFLKNFKKNHGVNIEERSIRSHLDKLINEFIKRSDDSKMIIKMLRCAETTIPADGNILDRIKKLGKVETEIKRKGVRVVTFVSETEGIESFPTVELASERHHSANLDNDFSTFDGSFLPAMSTPNSSIRNPSLTSEDNVKREENEIKRELEDEEARTPPKRERKEEKKPLEISPCAHVPSTSAGIFFFIFSDFLNKLSGSLNNENPNLEKFIKAINEEIGKMSTELAEKKVLYRQIHSWLHGIYNAVKYGIETRPVAESDELVVVAEFLKFKDFLKIFEQLASHFRFFDTSFETLIKEVGDAIQNSADEQDLNANEIPGLVKFIYDQNGVKIKQSVRFH
ncbi:hypothetical protein CRE_18826 [Caenorhabditis remanei]|uniref:Uncharacterized protein n=1 Tax=Caenorhabditis remanei TaxID=31234 RepID=E3LKQ0_CAERE|nr:hypothetical protein CRE_18826 [Caenorhabditis remanei]